MLAIKNRLNRAFVTLSTGCFLAKRKLREKDGSFFTENGLVVVIVVVIAIIIIGAMVALWKDTIIPKLGDKINDFFTMKALMVIAPILAGVLITAFAIAMKCADDRTRPAGKSALSPQ